MAGPFRASDLYREKSRAVSCREPVQENDRIQRKILEEFDRLNEKLNSLEQIWGQDLQEKLLGELRYYVDSYGAGLCCMSLRTMDPEAVAEVAHREDIDLLLQTLRRDFDLTDIEQTLRELDAAFLSMKEGTSGVLKKSLTADPTGNSDAISCQYGGKIREE